MSNLKKPLISVIMPTYNQANFLRGAVLSLSAQTFNDWELIIINDGSTDHTEEVLSELSFFQNLVIQKNERNRGLGNSLNQGLERASGKFIAYLPSDDLYFSDHLETLVRTLSEDESASLSISGIKYQYNKVTQGKVPGFPLQLVQVMHRKTSHRWVEREELVTDDLGRMFWDKLLGDGQALETKLVTCEWVSHPHQRHKKILEPEGGVNLYRSYYNVQQPLIFKSSIGNYINQRERFHLPRKPRTKARDGLKILCVGELAYNPERILTLEERGHQLYGLWMKDPHWFNYVGPLPFGHVQDLKHENWAEAIRETKPDIIYGLLNWQSVPFAHEVMMATREIPFVWHFKEGPFICREKGTWDKLLDLYSFSDGQIYTNQEVKDWFATYLPTFDDSRTLLLDGDLPKMDWFQKERSALLSHADGEIHTVVPGRPIGLHSHVVAALASQQIHLHFYGDYTQGTWREWIERTEKLAPGYLHIHPNVDPKNWVQEFSKYDAGWLHFFESSNFGELQRANWDDLNYPARIATLALAGVPLIQRDNTGHIVATQDLVKKYGIGVFFTSIEDLGQKLRDKTEMSQLRDNVWDKRHIFTFDHHTDRLVDFFRVLVERRKLHTNSLLGAIELM